MTLHEAIESILTKAKKPMSASELAFKLNQSKLYAKGDGSPIKSSQVSARVNKYPQLFNKESGLIALSNHIAHVNQNKKHSNTSRVYKKPNTILKTSLLKQDKLVKQLLQNSNFKPAGQIDALVPDLPGLYSIRIKNMNALPKVFRDELSNRDHDVLYIGIATKSLSRRMLGQELRAKGHGTFFRSLGAMLGYLPPKGSLKNHANKRNYKFSTQDEQQIINWINRNLLINCVLLDQALDKIETDIILNTKPIMNISKNPWKMEELSMLRKNCVMIANS